MFNSRDPIYRGGEDALDLAFTKELASNSPYAFKEIDANLLKALVQQMEITFAGSDHAHNKVLRRLITRILIFVVLTGPPGNISKKRQGRIETSTHHQQPTMTTLDMIKNMVEDLTALQYMLRCHALE